MKKIKKVKGKNVFRQKEYKTILKDLINSYFIDWNLKEENREIELKAVIILQKYAYRLIYRKRFLILKSQVLEVQKAIRGYLTRSNHL